MTHVTPQLVWSLAMKSLLSSVRLLAFSAAFVLPFASASAHAADSIDYFVPYSGEGNLVVFDAAAGTGGWVGAIDQSAFPVVPTPLSFVSQVLFTLDATSNTFSGSFEFNTVDLLSSIFGNLSGRYDNANASADVFQFGGQLSIDYQILGGSGRFAGASGFGLSLIDFDPAGNFNNYSEAGLLSFAAPVPEPSTWLLMGLGLGLLAWTRRSKQLSPAALG
jgi:PEP-CTERM motif